eukprot:Tamp_19870.p1 GENE.Tamp_19870~~Tamp_19870.p1  ORF type:complete len:233 (+),score=38.17 Tamp_19870:103-699(+)
MCAGDYPWWSCCNCAAAKSGWAGWARRACHQCRQRDKQAGDAAANAAQQNEADLGKRKAAEAALAQTRAQEQAVTRAQARAKGEGLEAHTVIAEARQTADEIIRKARVEAEDIKAKARQEAERIVSAVTPRGTTNGRGNASPPRRALAPGETYSTMHSRKDGQPLKKLPPVRTSVSPERSPEHTVDETSPSHVLPGQL